MFRKTLKKKYVRSRELKDAEEAEMILVEALEDYSRHRIHSSIEYTTLDEFAKSWQKTNSREIANR